MSIQSVHPLFTANIARWELMRDGYAGEDVVKRHGEKYLPPTKSQIIDGMLTGQEGRADFDAYVKRARFPDYIANAIEQFQGMIHSKPAVIEVPPAMEPLIEKLTIEGESAQALLARITLEQLLTGRCGLLLDMPPNPDPTNPMPYVVLYTAEAIRNWNQSADNIGLNATNLVVLDESLYVMNLQLEWKLYERYRVLHLTDAAIANDDGIPEIFSDNSIASEKTYFQGVFTIENDGSTFDLNKLRAPMFRGAKLNQIPFVFVNTRNITAVPETPPLLGLAHDCLGIYRGEADYRQNLYMQGQDTLVVIGGMKSEPGDTTRVGAGSKIDVDLQGDAKYIGVDSQGLPEQRLALENDRKEAVAKAGRLISPTAGKVESGDALDTRLAAQTASLGEISKTSCAALEMSLKIAAIWMGQDPNKVKCTPNLDFKKLDLSAKDVLDFTNARNMGAPLSDESLHGNFVRGGLTNLSYEEERLKIEEEDAQRGIPVLGGPANGN